MSQFTSTQKNLFGREFLCLWGIAVAITALSTVLASLPPAALVRQLVIPLHTQSTGLILLALSVENSLRLAIVVGVGIMIAHKLGLGAPVLEAWFRHEPVRAYIRAAILPIVLTVAVLTAASSFARAPLFRQKRIQDSAATDEFANSRAAAEAFADLEKLGLTGGKPITNLSLQVLYLAGAIGGELEGRLFEVSVIILLIIQICGGKRTLTDWPLVWVAVLAVALVHTAENVVVTRENTLLVLNVFRNYGLAHELEPVWLAWARTGLRVIPSAVALGLLYVYRGIESSIVASFCAASISLPFTTFWLTHFR